MSYSGSAVQSSRSKWSNRFPVYQIDFTAVASGKRVATSKRRVRWRFGFSNKEALEAGETGTACRGEEHDVTVVWSVTSGKRLVLADGQEVHYSTVRSGVFEFSWTLRGNHVLKVVAHAAPQLNPTPGFRQYDLNVDGQSFFVMPKVYELGIRGPIASHAPVSGASSQTDRSAPPQKSYGYYDLNKGDYLKSTDKLQEETDLQKAIQDSIEESRKHLQKREPSGASDSDVARKVTHSVTPAEKAAEVDLLDMMGSVSVSSPPVNNGTDAFNQVTQQVPYVTTGQNQMTSQPFPHASSHPVFSAAPVQASKTYSQQVPGYGVGNQQFVASNQYQAPNSATDTGANQPESVVTHPSGTTRNDYSSNYQSPASATSVEHISPPNYQTQVSLPAVNVSSVSHVDTDPMMNKLVNFDNIRAPVKGKNETLLTNIFSDASKGADNGNKWNGPQPSLSEMQSSKAHGTKQEVMTTAYNSSNSNALVATGNQPGYAVQLPQAYTQNPGQGYGSAQNQAYQQQQPYDYQQQVNQQQYYSQFSQQQQQYGGYQQPPPSY